MENYYNGAASYPDSGDSSPRPRDIDFENPPPWEEQGSQPSPNYKVKFMCSYGGSITPRPHDNQLSYVGGETKILSVERNIKFNSFVAKLSALCEAEVCFKYQLPGEDLDALISVTNDDDLEHMMHEYDRLFRGLAKPARLRLFLFDVHGNGRSETERPRSTEPKTDRERFVDALNSGPSSVDGSSPHCPQPILPGNNVDFLFAIEKGVAAAAVAPQPVVAPAPVMHVPQPEIRRDERIVGSDPVEIQKRIVELQRMQIGNDQAAMYQQQQQQRTENNSNNNNSNNLVTGYPGDFYKLPEKLPPANVQQGYWQETKQMPTSGYPSTMTTSAPHEQPPPQQQQQQQPIYMIPAQGGVYQAQMRTQAAQVTAPVGQGGFYAVPREPQIHQQQVHQQQQQIQQQVHQQQQQIQQQVHQQQQQIQQQVHHQQQQQMYNVVTQAGPKMVQATYPPEMVRRNVINGGMTDNGGNGYAQVAYDHSTGRQVYYTSAPPTAYHPAQQIAVSADMRPAAGGMMMGQPEGKVVVTKLP